MRKGRKPFFIEEKLKEIIDLYENQRLSAVIIADKYNKSVSSVTTALKKAGVIIRPKNISIREHWNRFKKEKRYKDYIKRKSEGMVGELNPMKSIATREKMSRTRAEGIASGRIKSRTYGKAKWHKGIYCRSTYEVRFLDLIDEKGIKDIIACPYIISYYYNGVKCHYVPDFYSPKYKTIFEIKPLSLVDDKINILKKEAAEKYCKERGLEYTVVTERTLTGFACREDIFLTEQRYGGKR